MRKCAVIIMLCLLSLMLLSACGGGETVSERETADYREQECYFWDPVYYREASLVMAENYGVELDEDCNNVAVFVENEPITTTSSVIECSVINQNKGKSFFLYQAMALEKKVGGTVWKRMKCKPYRNSDWSLVCVPESENDKAVNYKSAVVLNLDDIQEPLSPGDYRLVVFLGVRNLYVEIKIY